LRQEEEEEEEVRFEGNYRGRDQWYPGKVTRDRGDKTYDISYGDGEPEMRVPEDMIRLKDADHSSSARAPPTRLYEGD